MLSVFCTLGMSNGTKQQAVQLKPKRAAPSAAPVSSDRSHGRSNASMAAGRAKKITEQIQANLQYGATDWVVTEEEAIDSLVLLAGLSHEARSSLAAKLNGEGLLDRLFDNLPTSVSSSHSSELVSVCSVTPSDVLFRHIDELLSVSLIDSVSPAEAEQVGQILGTLPPAARERFVYKNNGELFERLLEATPKQTASVKEPSKGPTIEPPAEGETPGLLRRGMAAQSTLVDFVKGTIDFNDLQTVAGGNINGVRLESRKTPDENRGVLALDLDKGFFGLSIADLNIAAMHVDGGNGAKIATGSGSLSGVRIELKWATELAPTSHAQFNLEALSFSDIQILLNGALTVLSSVVLSGLSLLADKPPERGSKPLQTGEIQTEAALQLTRLVAQILPGMGLLAQHVGEDSEGVGALVEHIQGNFAGDLNVEMKLDAAEVRGVDTSSGDGAKSVQLTGLTAGFSQGSRVQYLEQKRQQLSATDPLTAKQQTQLAEIDRELKVLRPLEAERRILLRRRKNQGQLTMREEDRLVSLDNQLNEGQVDLAVESFVAHNANVDGETTDQASIESLRVGARGGSLNRKRETRAEQLDNLLGIAPKKTNKARGGMRGDATLGSATLSGLDGTVSAKSARLESARAEAERLDGPYGARFGLAAKHASVRELSSPREEIQRAEASGFVFTGETGADISAAASVDSLDVEGIRTDHGSIGAAHVQTAMVNMRDGGTSANLQVHSADVSDADVAGFEVGEASFGGLSVTGSDLTTHKPAAAARLDYMEVGSIRSEHGFIEDARLDNATGVIADDGAVANLQVDGAVVTGADVAGFEVGEARFGGLSVSGSGLTTQKPAADASLNSLKVKSIRSEHGSIESARAHNTTVEMSDGGASANLDVDSAIVTGAETPGFEVGEASFGGLSVTGSGLTTQKPAADASLNSLKVKSIRSEHGSIESARVHNTTVKMSDGGASANLQVDRAAVSGAEIPGARVREANLSGLGVSGSALTTNKPMVTAEVAALGAREVDALGYTLDAARASDVSASGGNLTSEEERVLTAKVGSASLENLSSEEVALHRASAFDISASTRGGEQRLAVASVGLADLTYDGDEQRVALGAAEATDLTYEGADAGGAVRIGEGELHGLAAKTTSGGSATADAVHVKGVRAQANADGLESAVIGSAEVSRAAVKDGTKAGSLGHLHVRDGSVRRTGSGAYHAGVGAGSASNLEGQVDDSNRASVGTANIQESDVLIGPDGSMIAARTAGVDASDFAARLTQGEQAAEHNPKSLKDMMPAEKFMGAPIDGASGTIKLMIPVLEPIKTSVSVEIAVKDGIADLSGCKTSASGVLGTLAIGGVKVNKRGALVLDVLGPWNPVLIDPGAFEGLQSKKQGGGKQGSVAARPMLEWLLNKKLRNVSDDSAVKEPSSFEDGPCEIDWGAIQVDMNLGLGDGRIGLESIGATFDGGGNQVAVQSAAMGETISASAELHARDIQAGPATISEASAKNARVRLNSPDKDGKRSVDASVRSLHVGETKIGDRSADDSD